MRRAVDLRLTVALAGILSTLLALPGCDPGIGGGGSSTSSIAGRLVDAGNPAAGIGDTYVYVVPKGTGGRELSSVRQAAAPVAQTFTDAYGHYVLTQVPVGSYDLGIQPPPSSGYLAALYQVDVGSAPLTLDLTHVTATIAQTIGAIQLQAGTPQGGKVTFTATVLGTNNQPLSPQLKPTWTVTASIGTIDADGVFTASSRGGVGTVSACLAGHCQTATVTVTSTTGGTPNITVRSG